MNNIAPKVESTQSATPMQRQSSSAVTQACSDPFLQIINRLVANMEQNEQEGVSTQTEEPETLAMLAQFFAQMSNLQTEQTEQTPQLDANITNVAINFEQLKNFMAQNNMQVPQVLQELSAQQNTQTQKAPIAQTNTLNFENLIIDDKTNAVEQNSNIIMFQAQSSSANTEGEQLFSEQHNFFKSIETVKKDMQTQNTVDMQEVLAQLNAQHETQSTQAATPIATNTTTQFELPVKNTELFNQLQVGLQEGVDAELPQFTLKLNPQELGEITVKLLNDGGQQVLEITVASSKTSLMINDDIDALRQAMAPMQIEVKEAVVTSAAQSEQSQMQNFNMENGQFANRQNQPQQTMQNSAYNGEFTEPEEQTVEQTFIDDSLSVYI